MPGSQRPRIRIAPAGVDTYGGMAADFMANYGMVLDEWQRLVMDDWLAVDARGKYVASPCGLSVPRQNGKTALVTCRCLYGIVAMNEQILYTAHEVKTARKTFNELAKMLDPNGAYPELAAQVEYIRRANGQEEIKLIDYEDEETGEWLPGGCISFSARSRGASRGFTMDCLVLDEAQELTAEQLAALMPTISAGANRNPQVIMLGTPPAPGQEHEVFVNTREKALGTDPGSNCWHEWSIEALPKDNRDWSLVEATNPALDIRLLRSAVEAEMGAMPVDYFARERLGWWSPVKTAEHPIAAAAWDACRIAGAPPEGLLCYGVKFSADNATVSLSVCVKPKEGPSFIECVENRNMAAGIGWLVDWLTIRKGKAAQIIVDGRSGAQTLVERLKENGVPPRAIMQPSTRDVIAACSSLLNAVKEKTVCHAGQPGMAASATLSVKRRIGTDGGWGFGSTAEADSTIIESAALAFWAAQVTKRDPGRKAKVW